MDKPWYQSKTILSGVIWAIAGILESYGIYPNATNLVQTLAVAGVIYGIRDAMD